MNQVACGNAKAHALQMSLNVNMSDKITEEECDACKVEKKYEGRSYLHSCGKSNLKDEF